MTVCKHVVLVRHGETEPNARGAFVGSTDVPLASVGKDQATKLGAALAVSASDAVIASPLRRAASTACLAAPGYPVASDDRLREVDFGPWEGRTTDEVREIDPDGLAAFESGELWSFAGGESVTDAGDRLRAAVQDPVSEPDSAGRLVLLTHATAIRLLAASLLGLPLQHYRALFGRPDHASYSDFHEVDGRWRLACYNRTAP